MIGKQKTHEEFLNDLILRNSNSDTIEILSRYENSNTKILCKCKLCNHKWEVRPDALLRGSGCSKCANVKKSIIYKGRSVKQNPEILKQKFMDKYNQSNADIELLEDYINSETKIKVKCKIHGAIWYGKPLSILKGKGCKQCRNEKFKKSALKTQEQFEKEIYEANRNTKIIGKYQGYNKTVTCECLKCGFVWNGHVQPLLEGVGCRKCSAKERGKSQTLTNDEFLKQLRKVTNDIVPLEQYVNSHTKILFKCLKDGYEWLSTPSNILSLKGCPVCSNRVTFVGINDIATTHPHIVKYLVNKNDAYNYVAGSNKYVQVKCPDCGFKKDMCIHSLTSYGFTCNICSDNLSYPNKFLRGFIQQLPIENIEYEYNPSWAKLYKYDVYFNYGNNSYIIEMDGGFHYITTNLRTENDMKIQIKRDKEKDYLANKHNIKVIRIDCRKSNLKYIKNNIINSELNSIFNLSNVDWEICDIFGKTNLIKKVCNIYNSSENKNLTYIGDICNLERHTVGKYLKIGNKYGFCKYISKPIKKAKEVYVYNLDNKLIHNFKSVKETARKMTSIYNDNFSESSIRNHCNNNQPYKSFIFKYLS